MTEFDPALPVNVDVAAATAAEATVARTGPEPWEEVAWALVLPGLAHLRLGRTATAVALFTGYFALGAGGLLMLVAPGITVLWSAPFIAGGIALQVWAAFDAHRIARGSATLESEADRHARRDAWKGLLLTRFVPGLGHLYDGRVGPGVAFLFAAFAINLLPDAWGLLQPVVLVPLASLELWRRFRGRRDGTTARMRNLVLAGLAMAAVQPGITAALRARVVHAYRMPSRSMLPTIRPGDALLVDVTRRGLGDIGDVVVFPFPSDPAKTYVKRVFARAGDVVEFRGDGAFRNGIRVIAPPVLTPGEAANIPLAGEGHPYTVPAGQVFLVGDNVLASNDSRFYGPVPEKSLAGRAAKLYWPPERWDVKLLPAKPAH